MAYGVVGAGASAVDLAGPECLLAVDDGGDDVGVVAEGDALGWWADAFGLPA